MLTICKQKEKNNDMLAKSNRGHVFIFLVTKLINKICARRQQNMSHGETVKLDAQIQPMLKHSNITCSMEFQCFNQICSTNTSRNRQKIRFLHRNIIEEIHNKRPDQTQCERTRLGLVSLPTANTFFLALFLFVWLLRKYRNHFRFLPKV